MQEPLYLELEAHLFAPIVPELHLLWQFMQEHPEHSQETRVGDSGMIWICMLSWLERHGFDDVAEYTRRLGTVAEPALRFLYTDSRDPTRNTTEVHVDMSDGEPQPYAINVPLVNADSSVSEWYEHSGPDSLVEGNIVEKFSGDLRVIGTYTMKTGQPVIYNTMLPHCGINNSDGVRVLSGWVVGKSAGVGIQEVKHRVEQALA